MSPVRGRAQGHRDCVCEVWDAWAGALVGGVCVVGGCMLAMRGKDGLPRKSGAHVVLWLTRLCSR